MNFVGYCRVSTDDKGQDPERQKDVIAAWARQHGHDVLEWVRDEGTSGATDPFQRQYVLAAIERAKSLGAVGIVVESVDRWTRSGVEALSVSRFFLRLDHDLRLFATNTPAGLTPEMEEMWDSMMATVARMFRSRLQEQIKSGIARAKANGWPHGQPGRRPKPGLNPVEKEMVHRLSEGGMGLDLMSLELSKARGAFDVADPKRQAMKRVGPTWLHKQIRDDPQMVKVSGRLSARGRGVSAPKQHVAGSEAKP